MFTTRDEGVNDTLDSDAEPATGLTEVFPLAAGQSDLKWDAGLLPIDLELEKSVDNATPVEGSQVVFTVLVRNVADFSTATGVEVTDVLPAGMTFVSASPLPGTYDSGTGVWAVGTLAGGASATLHITARVDEPGTKTNSAEVTKADQRDIDSTPGNGNPAEDDQGSVPIDVQPLANAEIGDLVWTDVNADGLQDAGEPGRDGIPVNLYRDLDNDGTAEPGGDDGAPFASTVTAGGGLYLFSGLVAGKYFVQFLPPAGQLFTALDAGSDTGDSDADPATGLTAVFTLATSQLDLTRDAGLLPIDLELEKTVDNAAPVEGSQVVFSLVVRNAAGSSTATGVEVTDLLPAGLTCDTAAVSQGSYDSNTGLWIVGTLAGGESATLDITATVDTLGTKVNTAEVTRADQPDTDSTPGNANPAEDDQGSVQIDPLPLTNAEVGDLVWTDLDLDGLQDAGEPGRDGITVELYLDGDGDGIPEPGVDGPAVATTATAGGGVYSFTGLAAGNYFLWFRPPSGELFTTRDEGVDDSLDSDADPDTGLTQVFPLAASQSDLKWDAGLLPIDLELEKTVDDAAPPEGSQVTYTVLVRNAADLSTATGVEVTDVLPTGMTYVSSTASQGSYDSGTGLWTVGALAGGSSATLSITATVDTLGTKDNTAQVTRADQSDADSTPGNANPAEDDQDSVSIVPLPPAPAQIGNFVWTDLNRNGLQDVGEPGRDGITVNLYRDVNGNGIPEPGGADGTSIASTVTAGGGGYLIAGIPAGNYFVQFVRPSGQLLTMRNVGINDNVDSDPDRPTGLTEVFPLAVGQTDMKWDAGFVPIDLALDKTVDNTTPVVGSQVVFTVLLRNAAGFSEATGIEVTDLLPAGMTYVTSAATQGTYDSGTGLWDVGALAAGASATLDITATVDALGAEINAAEVTKADQPDTDSTPGNENLGEDDRDSVQIDPQPVANAEVGNFVWTDRNADGLQDAGEPGRDGITVNLYQDVDNDGVAEPGSDDAPAIATTVTAGGGLYLFTGLVAGNYFVEFQPPSGQLFTLRDVGGDDTDDSDPDPTTGLTAVFPLATSQSDLTWDAGLRPIDLELEKTVDQAAPVVGSQVVFTVLVRNVAGFSTATGVQVTDLLPAGTAYVSSTVSQGGYNPVTGVWSAGTLAGGAAATLNITATVNTLGMKTNTAEVTGADQLDNDSTPGNGSLTEDDRDSVSIDPQPLATAQVGNFVWIDVNNNGLQDAGEPGRNGITVNLYRDLNANGIPEPVGDGPAVATTVTAGGGSYQFPGLVAGNYFIQFVRDSGQLLTKRNAGVNDNIDSDPDRTTGLTEVFPLAAGQTDLKWDAGFLLVDLSLTKTVSNGTPLVGDNVIFLLTVANEAGFSTATGVEVTDVLPPETTFVSAVGVAGELQQRHGCLDGREPCGGRQCDAGPHGERRRGGHHRKHRGGQERRSARYGLDARKRRADRGRSGQRLDRSHSSSVFGGPFRAGCLGSCRRVGRHGGPAAAGG